MPSEKLREQRNMTFVERNLAREWISHDRSPLPRPLTARRRASGDMRSTARARAQPEKGMHNTGWSLFRVPFAIIV